MPKFTELEKVRIRIEILQAAHRCFIDKGFKNTSIEELTSLVGIAKSSFYVFFESKEMLYLELLELEGKEIENRVWPEVKKAKDIQSALKSYLYTMSSALEANILTQRLITDIEEYNMVSRKVNPQYVGAKALRSVAPLMEFISSCKESKQIIEEEAEVIAGVIRAALLIVVHKKDVGEEVYSKVQDILFNAVANEVTK